ncbi:DUF4926 domain-containing protein [Fibrella aquatica]|uniref:DUF4926 domain-containing protein n=1 Tax=Fibrella aquatica TaxID=3242487 RepID=UPI00351FFF81
METLKLHDIVALTVTLPDHNLRRGDVGVIIDIGPEGRYLLEFADRNGIPYASPTVSGDNLLKVYLHADMVE